MSPFEPAVLPPDMLTLEGIQGKFGVSPEIAKHLLDFNLSQKVYLNDKYQVNVRRIASISAEIPVMMHLSIKRLDKEPIHDWRDLQAIKNQLIGPEHEGVEFYPAESNLTDTANQYHLWVFEDPTIRMPWGFRGRHLATAEQATLFGAKQRDRS